MDERSVPELESVLEPVVPFELLLSPELEVLPVPDDWDWACNRVFIRLSASCRKLVVPLVWLVSLAPAPVALVEPVLALDAVLSVVVVLAARSFFISAC